MLQVDEHGTEYSEEESQDEADSNHYREDTCSPGEQQVVCDNTTYPAEDQESQEIPPGVPGGSLGDLDTGHLSSLSGG